MEDIPEIEVSNLSFIHVFNTKIGIGIDKDHLNRSNLLTVSNKHGLVFAASDKKLKVMTMLGLDDQMIKMTSIRTSKKMVENDAVTFELEGEIVHLALNSSDEFLAVCTSKNGFIFAEVYDIRVLAKDSNQPFSPFQEIKLTSGSSEILVDFSWNPNPDFSRTFVSCSSSGWASVFEVHPAEVKLVGSIGPSSQEAANTCACWSPKGKQVAIGSESGKVTLYLPTMSPKNVIQVCPKVKEGYGDVAVMDILWETNCTFFIVYKSKSNDSEQPLLVYLKPQNNQPTYSFYGDVCFGGSGSRHMRYQFNLIRQWNLLLISSATSSEMCLLAKEKDTWYKCDLEHKPEVYSLGNDFEIYCPRGVCLVYCSGFKWTIKVSDEEKSVVSLPVMMMSSDGCLSSLQFVTQNPDHQSLNVVPQSLSSEGALAGALAQPQKVLPAPPRQPSAPVESTPDPTSFKPNLPSLSFVGAQYQVFQANPMSFSGPSQATATSNDCSHVPSNPIADKISSDPPGGRHAPAAEPVPKSGKTPQLGNFGQPTKVDEPLTFKGRHEESSTVASEVPADGRDDPYAQSIAEEIGHFSRELKDILQRLSTFKVDPNFSAELEKLNSGMKTLLVHKSDLCKELLDLKKESEEQRTETLELFATMERFRATHERNNDKNYLALLRHRPLDPTRKSMMAALESALGYVGIEISKVDSILDSNLQECLDAQKRQRFIQPPNLHVIYETLHSNRISIGKIKTALSLVKKRIDADPNLGKNNALNLSQLFTRSCTLTSPKGRQRVNQRDKEAQLREYLLNRKVATVRSTAPENLNCSRIVSAVQMREIEGRKNSQQQQQQQLQSPKTPLKQQQHQREFVQPKQKTLSPAFGQPVKHLQTVQMVPNPPSIDFSSAPQVPRMSKMFSPSKDSAKEVPFESSGVTKYPEQASILPSITNMTLPSFDSAKPFFSSQPSFQLQPSSTTTTGASNTFADFSNISEMSKTSAPLNKNMAFNLSSLTTSTPLFKTFEGLSTSKPVDFSAAFKSSAEGVTGASMKSVQPSFTFASLNLPGSKASTPESPASETSPQTPGKELAESKKPELIEKKTPKILILQEPLKMMKQMGDEIGKPSFFVGGPDSNPVLKLTTLHSVKASLADMSSDRSTVPKKEEESKDLKSASFVIPPESNENVSVDDVPRHPEEGKAFDLSKKSSFVSQTASSNSSPSIIDSGSLGLFGVKKVEPLSVKATNISEVLDMSQPSGKHEISGDKTSLAEASATGTTMLGSAATSSSASGRSSIFVRPSTPTASPNITTGRSPLFGAVTSDPCLSPTSSAVTPPAFGSVDSVTASATSALGNNGGLPQFGKDMSLGATLPTIFGAPTITSTEMFETLAITSTSAFGALTSISTAVLGSSANTTASSSVFGATKTSAPSIFGSSTTTTAPIFGSSTTTTAPIFGSSTTTASASVFGSSTTATTASAPIFGASATPVFGTSSTVVPSMIQAADNSQSPFARTTVAPSIFGSPAPSIFGAPASAAQTVFGAFGAPSTPAQSVFGDNKPVSPFAASSSGPTTGNASSSIFGGSPFGKASSAGQVFGSPSNSIFSQTNTSTSAFSGNSFGKSGAPVFGQGSVFGQASTPSANEPGGIFGSSGTFGGLGGKPSKEKAATNVFGNISVFGSTSQASSIFGQSQTSSGFGSVKTDVSIQGSFTGSNSNVASSGFGGFQKPAAPAFGSTGAFGGTPVFGSLGSNNPTAFGGAPTFGGFGASTIGSPGGTQGRLFGTGSGDNGGFASLANASTPSFEGLVQRSGGAEFGNVPQQGGFGSFGGGEQSSSGFGTTFQSKSPQFTQFRS